MTNGTLTGHLDYYKRHGINPVRYEMGNLQLHFDRRGSLYRTLGVTPLTVRGCRAVEVAPGTGQNSLWVANQCPAEFTLVEPNPVAIRDITALYAKPGISPVTPKLVESTFQDFNPAGQYDFVVCENWLGHSATERQYLRKLGRLVADRGVLVVTTVSPVGVLPNVLRKALTCRLDKPEGVFAERTAVLSEAFGPHLRTIPAMTRSVTDWVHDNVMNPAYFGIMLTIPMVLDDLGASFDVLGSNPRFAADWRWFKALCGENREFSDHFLGEYHGSLHNFLDYRTVRSPRPAAKNVELEAASWEAGECVLALEQALYAGKPLTAAARAVDDAVARVQANMADLPESRAALDEFRAAFGDQHLTAAKVAGMKRFGPLFGRETVYVSLEKARA